MVEVYRQASRLSWEFVPCSEVETPRPCSPGRIVVADWGRLYRLTPGKTWNELARKHPSCFPSSKPSLKSGDRQASRQHPRGGGRDPPPSDSQKQKQAPRRQYPSSPQFW